jgi:16S rRNA (guanine527-N7)-methyltransferase
VNPHEKELLCNGAKEIGIELTVTQTDHFDLFTKELLRWNTKLNLTSLRSLPDIITKHYIDSLTICNFLPAGSRLLDVGSGGGFPSIPLKIVRSDLDLVSVDSVQKKINFQRQISRLLKFEKFRSLHARVEEMVAGEMAGSFDFVVARAVADITILARMAVPFLAKGGKLIAMKGSRWKEEIAQSEGELDAMGLLILETRELKLPIIRDERCVIILGLK